MVASQIVVANTVIVHREGPPPVECFIRLTPSETLEYPFEPRVGCRPPTDVNDCMSSQVFDCFMLKYFLVKIRHAMLIKSQIAY